MLLCLVCLAGISCGGFIDRLTPCEITVQSTDYAEAEFPPLGIMTLYEARQIKDRIKIKHRVTQTSLKRLAEDDKTKNDDALGFIIDNIAASEKVQSVVVGSLENPMSLMGLLGISGLTFVAGSARKRKNDKSPDEVNEIVAKAKASAMKEKS